MKFEMHPVGGHAARVLRTCLFSFRKKRLPLIYDTTRWPPCHPRSRRARSRLAPSVAALACHCPRRHPASMYGIGHYHYVRHVQVEIRLTHTCRNNKSQKTLPYLMCILQINEKSMATCHRAIRGILHDVSCLGHRRHARPCVAPDHLVRMHHRREWDERG